MSRTIPLLLALGFLTLTPPSSAQETSSVWQYLGQRATRLAAQLPPLSASAEDWDKQRTELTSRLHTTLGLPNREPMQATVISCKQSGDLAIEEVAFHWSERVYTTGTVIRRQQAEGPQPAVVLTPDWLGHYAFRAYRSLAEQL
nr:hypothetical protein [Pirellulaceae bacterium]